MSHGNGHPHYDAEGGDNALHRRIEDNEERSARVESRIADAVARNSTTVDRLAVALGRLSNVEQELADLKKLAVENARLMALVVVKLGAGQ